MMRNGLTLLAASALLTLTACTAADTETTPTPLTDKQAKLLSKELNGKTAGEPVDCISDMPGNDIIRVSDDMLLYRVSGRLVYQNKLRSSCPGLARDHDVIVTEKYGSQQCRGDLIRLVDRIGGLPGPVCVLGDFVPYRKAPTGQ